jgi:hypothetical protein
VSFCNGSLSVAQARLAQACIDQAATRAKLKAIFSDNYKVYQTLEKPKHVTEKSSLSFYPTYPKLDAAFNPLHTLATFEIDLIVNNEVKGHFTVEPVTGIYFVSWIFHSALVALRESNIHAYSFNA